MEILTPRKNRSIPLQCQTSGAFFHHVIRASSSESVRELFRVFGSANHITTLCGVGLPSHSPNWEHLHPALPWLVVNPLHTQEDSVCQTCQRMNGRTWTELKPILAPWHEHLAIATSQNISEKLCHSHLCTLSWGALAVRSRAHVCKILLNSNMLRLTYPVEHEFETARLPQST